MNIEEILAKYHVASNTEKEKIKMQIQVEFESLTIEEQKKIQNSFLLNFDKKIEEAGELIREVNLKLELENISKYVSMSYIAERFFNRSKQWFNNRIKGNLVNGAPAKFTTEEQKKLSEALKALSNEINETALHISN